MSTRPCSPSVPWTDRCTSTRCERLRRRLDRRDGSALRGQPLGTGSRSLPGSARGTPAGGAMVLVSRENAVRTGPTPVTRSRGCVWVDDDRPPGKAVARPRAIPAHTRLTAALPDPGAGRDCTPAVDRGSRTPARGRPVAGTVSTTGVHGARVIRCGIRRPDPAKPRRPGAVHSLEQGAPEPRQGTGQPVETSRCQRRGQSEFQLGAEHVVRLQQRAASSGRQIDQ